MGYFNPGDLKQYQTAFEFPVVRFADGVLEVLSDPDVLKANFENIAKTGWVTSRMDSISGLSESSQAALMGFSFSRIYVSGNEVFNSTGYNGLVNTYGGWKVQSIFFESDYCGDGLTVTNPCFSA